MRGGRIEKLPKERLEAYNINVTRKKTKRSTRPTSNSGNTEKHDFPLAGIGGTVFDSKS